MNINNIQIGATKHHCNNSESLLLQNLFISGATAPPPSGPGPPPSRGF